MVEIGSGIPPLKRSSKAAYLNQSPPLSLSKLDIRSPELEQAYDEQYDPYGGHAQKVGPVHALEDGVAIEVKDGE
ncbi:MAG TPA: hypothetical protein VFA41_23730 [Ktedonobacteraceae bacterium]|nr:hypothetical protein [Ktedonobacteraceae bacterium]